MEKLILNGVELTVSDVDQIINMGGPWIGTLSLNGRHISDSCIADNFLLSPDNEKLFFINYHFVSNWQKENFFTIYYYDIATQDLFKSLKTFNMVYIKSFLDDNKLEIHKAFHGENERNRMILNLEEECFKKTS